MADMDSRRSRNVPEDPEAIARYDAACAARVDELGRIAEEAAQSAANWASIYDEKTEAVWDRIHALIVESRPR